MLRSKAIMLLLFITLGGPFYLFYGPASGWAAVDWNVEQTLKLDSTPVDMAISRNGRWIYILTDRGTVLVYTSGGVLKGKIRVGKHIDQIQAGHQEDLLLMKSRQRKTVEVLSIAFIKEINVSGSPFKGPANASVVIAVFSEFQ